MKGMRAGSRSSGKWGVIDIYTSPHCLSLHEKKLYDPLPTALHPDVILEAKNRVLPVPIKSHARKCQGTSATWYLLPMRCVKIVLLLTP